MALTAGQRLGPYEILAPIGAGGMGEVYRAHDTKLHREVALKVLPETIAPTPERLVRFEREAHLLASLNHPNIATIHGLEQAEGIELLVLELVEGETLAERIAQGPLPLAEALPLFGQIAEGLEAAHEKGIIHRDLKPANIKITPKGQIKILDFGLAKALAGAVPAQDLSQSPTLTRGATEAGVLLGTAPYMSPEQARGKSVDERTDVWAFGCCLYEAITGKVTLLGETVSDTIAAILERQPDWQALPEKIPPSVRTLLRRCLEKDGNLRFRHMEHARISLEETGGDAAEAIAENRTTHHAFTILLATGVLLAFFAGAIIGPAWRSAPPQQTLLRFALPDPEILSWSSTYENTVTISPDGTRIVFASAARTSGIPLYLRAMDRLATTPIPGTEGGAYPFFSHDGKWVGFVSEGKLKKVRFEGGDPIVLCDVSEFRGGSWGPNDAIVFNGKYDEGLSIVSAAGGNPRPLTVLDAKKEENSHRWPQILSSGNAVVFTVRVGGTFDDARIVVQSLDTGERHTVVEGGSFARYVPSGHLVFARGASLMAAPFDSVRLELTGAPDVLLDDLLFVSQTGAAAFDVSETGILVYRSSASSERMLVWVDKNGKNRPVTDTRGGYSTLRLSPDGQRVALGIQENQSDVWVLELQRETLIRLTFDGTSQAPIWTADGQSVVFSFLRAGLGNLFTTSLDGGGAVEQLTASE